MNKLINVAESICFCIMCVFLILFGIIINNYSKDLEVADKYIQDLEEVIERDGTCVVDVCGTDAYVDYYYR